MKNSDDTIGNRNRDLPTCRAVPQKLRHRVPHESMFWRLNGDYGTLSDWGIFIHNYGLRTAVNYRGVYGLTTHVSIQQIPKNSESVINPSSVC
jgi:hypothetical protein